VVRAVRRAPGAPPRRASLPRGRAAGRDLAPPAAALRPASRRAAAERALGGEGTCRAWAGGPAGPRLPAPRSATPRLLRAALGQACQKPRLFAQRGLDLANA